MIQGITAVSSRAILRDIMRKERGSGSKKITALAVMPGQDLVLQLRIQ